MCAPKLRFLEFVDEWEEKKLNELYEIKNGLNKEKNFFGHGIKILNYMDVNLRVSNNEKTFSGLVNVDKSELSRYNVKPNDLFFTRTSETSDEIGLTSAYIGKPIDCVFSGFILRARPLNNNISSLFYAYYFRNPKNRYNIIKYSSITTRALIAGSNLSQMNIKYPNLEEQEKLASFLSKVDEKLELLEKKLQLWENYKKGMMQQIFSQKLRFKDENGKDYPDWEEKKLEETTQCLDNLRKPLNSKERQDMQGNIPYYGANGIVDYVNDYIFDESLVLLAEDGGNFNDFQNRPIAQLIKGKSWVNNHAHVLRNNHLIKIEFLYYSLVHKDIRKYINGTSRSKLNKSDMLSIKFNLPTLPEQLKIISLLSAIDDMIFQYNKELEINKEFKRGLLQQMFC